MVGLEGVVGIGAGPTTSASLARTGDGTPWTWGSNEYGQLALGTTNALEDLPGSPVAPPSVTGFAGGRPAVEEIVAYWPALIDRDQIEPHVKVDVLEA